MEYQVVFLINGKRERLVVEHVKEEYGVSPATFWTCWIVGKKHINGEGDTAEEAIQDMIKTKTMCDNMRADFQKAIDSSGHVFKTPIFESHLGAAVNLYTQQRDLIRRLK
jgi:hypothetical protein